MQKLIVEHIKLFIMEQVFASFERNGITLRVLNVSYEEVDNFLKQHPTFRPICFQEDNILVSDEISQYFDCEISDHCRMCGNYHEVSVISDDYRRKVTQRIPVQVCFPYLNREEREFIISSYCPQCQREIYSMNYSDDE